MMYKFESLDFVFICRTGIVPACEACIVSGSMYEFQRIVRSHGPSPHADADRMHSIDSIHLLFSLLRDCDAQNDSGARQMNTERK